MRTVPPVSIVAGAALVALALGPAACTTPGSISGEGAVDASAIVDPDSGSSPGRIDGGSTPGPEVCNQVDDNGDGNVDEGCSCEPGETQACWPGDPARRGEGICADGTQTCAENGEFSGWGPCEGAVMPSTEIPGNDVDEDCSGVADCIPDPGGENCSNDGDDDCDKLVDCDDPDCADEDVCCVAGEEICDDGQDNDCDRRVDCDDPDCADEQVCCIPSPEICDDGIDNDCDRRVDCRDDDCNGRRECCADNDEICDDGVDNDCDGMIDCDDTDDCSDSRKCTCTKRCPPGSVRWCDEPSYCAWGKQTCNPDGTWGACIETRDRPGVCAAFEYYNAWCCQAAGQCCQNYPINDESVGDCPPGELVCEPR